MSVLSPAGTDYQTNRTNYKPQIVTCERHGVDVLFEGVLPLVSALTGATGLVMGAYYSAIYYVDISS